MIRPTLFIGLGTTGLNILKSLRQLMFEEYGRDGLPIFNYVSIETDGGVDATDRNLADEIKSVKATIPKTVPISNKLDPDQPSNVYNKHLKNWLNPELLNYVQAFEKGAANIRMAGRLCLWENWETVRNALNIAYNAINAPDTKEDAVNALAKHYEAKERKTPEGNLIDRINSNIYIVGSLCGGSCSGMLIDIAYYCGHILGIGDTNNVYGCFTMFDSQQAASQDNSITVRAANCYAALWEINFYNHLRTEFNTTFPSGQSVKTTNKPFDYVSFVSRSNSTGGVFTKDNKFDEAGLNQMVSLNLFADTAGDTDGQKGAILIDGIGFTGIGELKAVPKGEIRTMSLSMSSFGLTAVWYPKYRIASASVSLIGQRLCNNWLQTHVDLAVIVSEASKEWETIFNQNKGELTSPKNALPIKAQIENLLVKAEAEFTKATSANQLKFLMDAFPQDDDGSFISKFVQGGQYYNLMNMQVPVCQKAFQVAIDQLLDIQLEKIDFNGTYGLGDIRELFNQIDLKIEQKLNGIPAAFPQLNMEKMNFDMIRSSEKDFWLKLLFLHEESFENHRDKLINYYKRLIIHNEEGFYQSVSDYLMRPILQNVRGYIGFGIPTAADGVTTIRQKLDKIETNLKDCVNDFEARYIEAVDQQSATAVKIVTNDPKNSVNNDAKKISDQIDKLNTRNALLNGKTMASFLEQKHSDLIDQMTTTYQRISLDEIPVKNVVEQVKQILEKGGTDALEIKNLGERSGAYQNFIAGYNGVTFAPPLKIISGHDPTASHSTLDFIQNQFVGNDGNITFPRIGITTVDHLLFFYQAESGFAMDDLTSFEILKDQFEKDIGPYGHSTHRDPDFYNLELYDKTQKLQRWCNALGQLVPEICQQININTFSGVLQLDYGRYVYEYPVGESTKWLALHDHAGVKELSMKQNESAYNKFFNAVQSCFMRLDRQDITDKILIPMLRKEENLTLRNQLNGFYRQFLDEVYSTVPDSKTAGGDTDLDSYFSKVRSTTSGQTLSNNTESSPSHPEQNVTTVNTTTPTSDTSDYEEIISETDDVVKVSDLSKRNVNTSSLGDYEETVEADEDVLSQDTPTEHSTPNTTEDEYKWSKSTPDAEPTLKEEEVTLEQQPEPETDTRKKRAQPSKEFDVANVNVKEVQRRNNPPKKE